MRGFAEVHAGETSRSSSSFEMMRLSPECLPLAAVGSGGSRRPTTSAKPYKSNFSADADGLATTAVPRVFAAKPIRSRLPASPTRESNGVISAVEINGASSSAAGEVILQWGHNKRSRGSRSDAGHLRLPANRRSSSSPTAADRVMPPPPYARGANLRPAGPPAAREQTHLKPQHHHPRPLRVSGEERPGRLGKRSPDKAANFAVAVNGAMSTPLHNHNNGVSHNQHHVPSADQHDSKAAAVAAVNGSVEKLEWPRIYLSLSRKEKEDDFMAMKGSKLPQRPKKRAKNIDRTLQYCFPGMWLADLTRGRYEVREKKCVKKKRKGLKGMESMDSDSE